MEGEEKMDKLMNNHWAMKIVALLLALMLFTSVHLETQPKSKDSGGIFVPTTDTETIKDIPVTGYFDSNKYIVSGIPQFVDVTLSGPINVIKSTKLQNDLEIYVDLRGYGVGTHKVKFKYKNISNKLDVKIEPTEVTAIIQEKVTKQFSVDVDLIHEDMIKDGYSAEAAIIKPNVVKVTGTKEEIEKILFVEARVDLQNAHDTIRQESKLVAYDKNGNVINVEIEPSVVNVTVPIISPSKSVPIKLNKKGQLKNGLSIVSLEPNPSEITIFGPQSILDKINVIDGITIDLGNITGDTELEIPVPDIEGVTKVSPEKIKVKIDVEEQTKKTFSNIPISIKGVDENLEYEIIDPENGEIGIDILGMKDVVDQIKASDLEAFVNVKGLKPGEHQVDLEINGPQNVIWEIPKDTVTVAITSKTEE